MKARFTLLIFMAAAMYCCQQKDWTGSEGSSIDADSAEFSGIDSNTLKEWLLLNKESDSLMNSAQLIIKQQSDLVETHPQDEREYISSYILKAQLHLDQMRKKVKYTREFVSHIQDYDPALEHTLDSLKNDYLQEKSKLEEALSKIR
ncbi:hypothetical protein [Flavobacterium sp.]|uniref:hypothetical protein n=1 Tax=Flavobacterium sp. TaxID=239 RepID=UPI0031E227C5